MKFNSTIVPQGTSSIKRYPEVYYKQHFLFILQKTKKYIKWPVPFKIQKAKNTTFISNSFSKNPALHNLGFIYFKHNITVGLNYIINK